MSNFWVDLSRPVLALAPMEDVTDSVFRQLLAKWGKPPVMFTEFTNCEGIQSPGQAKIIHRLRYTNQERPIVAQVWGKTPQDYFQTAKLISDLGFDGLDINLGCPVKKIIKQGCCSALIDNQNLALEVIMAAKEGLKGKIPLSIKTRIGFKKIKTEEWITFLLEKARPDVLTVHGRTAKEMSEVPNHWEEIAKINVIKKNLNSQTLILGNGDIQTYQEAMEKSQTYNLDGVMIGRGIFKNPFFFNPEKDYFNFTPLQKLDLLLAHLELFQKTWGNTKNFATLKRFFKIYLTGFPGSSQIRSQIMLLDNYTSVKNFINLEKQKIE